MVARVVHAFVSAIPDDADPTQVRPSIWNEDHVITGLEDYLQNLATGTNSLAVLGTATGDESVSFGDTADASGNYATAIGTHSTAGDHGTAVGNYASALGGYATAIGGSAYANGDRAVALGAYSSTSEANTVSLGNVALTRRITNVSNGIAATDAATVGQLPSTPASVGLGNVTNDAQTKAAIVPNTVPSAGQLLVGNAGGTAFAPVSSSGDVTIASTGAMTIGAGKVTEAMQVLADNTTGNATTGRHGYLLKLSNVATQYMDGTGAWSVPAGSGANTSLSNLASVAINASLSTGAGTAATLSATALAAITTAQAGIAANLTASAATAGSSVAGAAAGGAVTITSGAAARLTSGNANGGDISLVTGAGIGTGTPGKILIPQNGVNIPSIAFTGDTSNGIAYRGSNSWALVAGSNEIARIGSTTLLLLTQVNFSGSGDVGLLRNGAGVLEVNSTSSGTYRDLKLRNLLAGGGNGSYVQTPSMTVANLAAAATAGAGARAFVTDANTTMILGLGLAVVGGGANKVPVYSDGAAWLIG